MSRKISDFFQKKSTLQEVFCFENSNNSESYKIKKEFEESKGKQENIKSTIHTSPASETFVLIKNIKYEAELDSSITLPTANAHKNSTNNTIKIKSANPKKLKKYNNPKCKKSCKFCGKIFSESGNLTRHQRDIHSNEFKDSIVNCKICDKKFFKNENLIRHMKLKHSDGKFRKYECDFDGKIFKTRSELHAHMNRHLPNVNCKICNTELKIGYLSTHMKEIHSVRDKIPCDKCSKVFTNVGRLKIHLKIHERKFECRFCKKTLPSFYTLGDHINDIHENPGSHSCEICHKKFNRAENLRVHLKFHDKNRPKPFKCQRCDFATHSKANFNGHLKSHEYKDKVAATMQNLLKCKKCPALLKHKDAFRQHMKTVHIEALYQCDLCGKAIKIKNNVKNHILVHIKNRLRAIQK